MEIRACPETTRAVRPGRQPVTWGVEVVTARVVSGRALKNRYRRFGTSTGSTWDLHRSYSGNRAWKSAYILGVVDAHHASSS
jgi:hypothetical protein